MTIGWEHISFAAGIISFIMANTVGIVKYLISKIEDLDKRLTKEIEKSMSTYLTRAEFTQIIMNLTDELKALRSDSNDGYRKLNSRLDTIVDNFYKVSYGGHHGQ
jgi:hypothetical protein